MENDDSTFFHSLFYRVMRGHEREGGTSATDIYIRRALLLLLLLILLHTHAEKKRRFEAKFQSCGGILETVCTYHSQLDKPDVRENTSIETRIKRHTHIMYIVAILSATRLVLPELCTQRWVARMREQMCCVASLCTTHVTFLSESVKEGK